MQLNDIDQQLWSLYFTEAKTSGFTEDEASAYAFAMMS